MRNGDNLSVLFWANKARKSEENLVPIYARITYKGKRAEISVNLKVDINRWDPKLGLINDSSPASKKINTTIGSVRQEIERAFDILNNTSVYVTADRIKSKYLGEATEQRKLLEVFDEHNKKLEELIGKGVVKGTHTKYETIRGKVFAFINYKFKTSDLYLESLQYSFITDFEHYLKVQENISHNVVMSYIKRVKRIVNLAHQNKWIAHNPFIGFVCSMKKTVRTELEMEELSILENKEFATARLKEVADCYLFSCYTGYAFVDASKLTPLHVKRGRDGELWIKTDRTKSNIEANVPLMAQAIKIIDRYKDHPVCNQGNRLLPMRSNQKMNEYLKEIATICGISKNLTTHTARHTFATTVTLENDVPIESVSKILGHTKISTTQIYARVKEKKVSRDMTKLKSKIINVSNPDVARPGIDPQGSSGVYDLIISAQKLTEICFAPILRERKEFTGQKISLSWISYREYLNYRKKFDSLETFFEQGETFPLVVHVLGDCDHWALASQLLNNSTFFLERNMTAKLLHCAFNDGFSYWATI